MSSTIRCSATPKRSLSSRWEPGDRQRQRQALIFLVILPLIDLALAGYVLLVDFESPASLRLDLAFFPEPGLLYLAMLVLTLGWGSLRTVLAIRKLFVTPVILKS